MKLSADNKKALDAIREKIVAKSTEYTEDEMIKLNAVFGEVLSFTGKKPRKVDKSCSSCIMEAVKIVYNYVTYHEPASPVHRPTIVREVKPEDLNLSGEMKEVKALRIVDGEVSEVTMDIPADLPDGYSVEGKVKETKPLHTETPVKKTRRPRTVKPKSK